MWKDSKFLWLIFASIVVGILEFFALAGLRFPSVFAIPFFLGFILIIGYDTLWHGLKALIKLNFKSIQVLMLLAVGGAFYLGQYEEAAVVIVLYTLAEKLEEIGIEQSQSALRGLVNNMPQWVRLKRKEEFIPIEEVQVGEIILIKPGEKIALDGKVVGGFSYVDEAMITGEPIPKDKSEGDLVYEGSLNKQGYLEIEVTKRAKESTLAKIQELTLQAEKFKAKTERFIEVFSQFYTPTIVLLAFLWVSIPTLVFGAPLAPWLSEGLALIVIACPCALVISTPISIYSAIGNASRRGILVKGGKFLEAIGQIRAMGLDKTRTLTYGKPIVSDLIPFEDHTKDSLLECAAGIEIFSEHPLAQSIVEAAKKGLLTPHQVENFKSIAGKGVQADCLACDDPHHCLGKLSFILEEHRVPQQIVDQVTDLQKQGKTVIIIANHRHIEGIIALTDEIRPDSFSLINELKKLKITPVMLTGDHPASAQAVADKLGITHVQADLLPQEKEKWIQKLQKEYQTVAMVGDGINDAPSLAFADVGITIESLGSDTAMEASNIILLHDRLDAIPFLIRLGKKTLQIIRFNTLLSIGIKAIFVALALMGMSQLALAIFADVGVTLIVILISLRLMHWRET